LRKRSLNKGEQIEHLFDKVDIDGFEFTLVSSHLALHKLDEVIFRNSA
jgi:hypothetical protein